MGGELVAVVVVVDGKCALARICDGADRLKLGISRPATLYESYCRVQARIEMVRAGMELRRLLACWCAVATVNGLWGWLGSSGYGDANGRSPNARRDAFQC